MGFSNVNDYPPSDTIDLSAENIKGKPVVVKYVKFQNVRSLTIFIEDNQSGSEVTKVQKIALYGTTLRGTTAGANNRMDLVSLVTSGVNNNEANHEEEMLDVVEGWQDDETHNPDPDVPAVSHSRGLTPFVFVPFEEVETSVVNLPVDKMDLFVPG